MIKAADFALNDHFELEFIFNYRNQIVSLLSKSGF